jgi:hypothetical protein
MPLGQSLLGGCAAKWLTRQCENLHGGKGTKKVDLPMIGGYQG